MATRERDRDRRRAGSTQRDAKHRAGGDWTTLSIPDGIEIFTPKEGSVKMDIVPYEAGKGNPYANEGELYYERTFYTHSRVGPNNESYVCPAKTAKKPCPICEYRARLAADPDGDEKLVKDLKPKERQIFLVRIHGKDGPEDKVRLYESSFHTFGKLLDKLRQEAEEDEPHKTDFDDPKAGAVLKVGYADKDAGGYSFVECYNIEFKPRPNGLDEDVLEHGICLDDCVKIFDYDELKRLFLQEGDGDVEDDEDEAKPPKKSAKKPVKEEEDDEDDYEEDSGFSVGQKVRHRQFGICTVKKITEDGQLMLVGKDGVKHPGADPKNVKVLAEKDVEEAAEKPAKVKPKPKPVEDDEDDEPPVKVKKTTKKPVEEEDDWNDDEDEEDNDEPPVKVKKTAKVKKEVVEEEDDWNDEDEDDEPPAKVKKTTVKVLAEKDDDWD